MSFKSTRLLCAFVGLLSLLSLARAESVTADIDKFSDWSVDSYGGVLFSVGSNASPLEYRLLPQVIALRSPPVIRREWAGGTFVVRSRFSLLLEPIDRGPESYFVGLAASPSMEWWDMDRSSAVFVSIGGGFGWMDAKGYVVEGAQGQSLNLNWFIHAGVNKIVSDRMSLSIGVYFQHISNGGMNKVNPGIDSVGPMVGVSWRR
jgi:hypothetical protein